MFGVVYSRLSRGRGISLWGAMAHPVFPPPPAGAASSGPLVDLGQPIPDVAGLCRTERAQTRVARIGSPMDSPSMGVSWARGAHRGTFMPPFFARCPQSSTPTTLWLGPRIWPSISVWTRDLSPPRWTQQPHSGALESRQAARSHGVPHAVDGMGLVRVLCGPRFHDTRDRVCGARSASPAPPFSGHLCLNFRAMARRMGWRSLVGSVWCGALWVLSVGTASAQPRMVTWAEQQYALRFPGSDLDARDSVRALLESWHLQPAYINSWPRDALEDIPFLSPPGAFQLGRYIAEQGDLIDPLEWGAIPLDSMERRAMQSFFQVGYPAREGVHSPRPWQGGISRTSSGWGPYVLGPGLRWTQQQSLSVLPWRVAWSPGNGPFLRSQASDSFFAWSPQRGGWGRFASTPNMHLGGGWIDNQWLLTISLGQPRWKWQGMLHGGNRWTSSCLLRWPSGMTAEWTQRSRDWALTAAWLPQPISPGWRLRLPYARGWLEAGNRPAHQWMRWQGRSAGGGLDRWNQQWRLNASLFLTPDLEAWVFVGCSPDTPHAWGWRYISSEDAPPFRFTVGWMGAGETYGYGTSPLRMTAPGPYFEGQWRPTWVAFGIEHQGLLTIKIRPTGFLWSGRYTFQSAQKWG